jgi:NitT/TauT family transport system permease protein
VSEFPESVLADRRGRRARDRRRGFLTASEKGGERRRVLGIDLGLAAARLGSLVVVLAIWQVAVTLFGSLDQFISRPLEVWHAMRGFLGGEGNFYGNLLATLSAAGIGFVLGIVIGSVIGFLLAEFQRMDRILDPWVAMLNAMPRIALAPLFVIWFGITIQTKVAVAVSVVIFVMLVATRSGIRSIDPDLLLVTRLSGASRLTVLRKVVLPGSTPAFFAGLRLSIVYALLGAVTAEMIAASNGIGQMILYSSGVFDIASTFALIISLAVAAGVINELAGAAERRLLRWQGPA